MLEHLFRRPGAGGFPRISLPLGGEGELRNSQSSAEYRFLSIKQQLIGVFGNLYLSQQSAGRDALVDNQPAR